MNCKLHIAPCSHEAAKYAVMHWHYSKCMPISKLVKYGVWEEGKFIGAVIFGRGASPQIGRAFKLEQTEVCELVRVALSSHKTPVSRIVAIILRDIAKKQNLRLIVSYADNGQNHLGVIYQAGNWVYTGEACKDSLQGYVIDGKYRHNRNLSGPDGTVIKRKDFIRTMELNSMSVEKVFSEGKHKYLYPLDKAMRKQIEVLRKPYPKCPGSETVSRPAIQLEVGGATPTSGLRESAVLDARAS